MIWRCAVIIWLLCFAQIFPNTSTKAAAESSEEPAEEQAATPTPTPAKKSKASKGEPTIGPGTTKSPPSRPDASSITKPPSQLDSHSMSATSANNFLVALDIGHTKHGGGAVSARGV